MTTVFDVLDELRAEATDEHAKGISFERLTLEYLKVDATWSQVFEDVVRYSDWPNRPSDRDVGVDLVGIEKDTGNLWAIQCKFYADDTPIDKKLLGTFFAELGKTSYSAGLIVSTSSNWTSNAEDTLKEQSKPVQRIGLSDLEDSSVDWSSFSLSGRSEAKRKSQKALRPHQTEALTDVKKGFSSNDRGKLIMACGTGKTYTSLKIAEDMLSKGGTVLFLVPSISLLSQSLREWTAECSLDLKSFAVCSDSKVGKKSESEDMHSFDLAYPATTNVKKLVENFEIHTKGFKGLNVVFSTYQSIKVISEAQGKGLPEFDLIICDEAHRTTGVTLADEEESAFVAVHNNDFIKGKKRLYMTATPRVYADSVKVKAEEKDAVLADMNDVSLYGPEFHRLMFGAAVERGLLSDYRVVILAVSDEYVSELIVDRKKGVFEFPMKDLPLDDVSRFIGCYNGLTKRTTDKSLFGSDVKPMKRAVAFAQSIKASQAFAENFGDVVNRLLLTESDDTSSRVLVEHVDGTNNVLIRNQRLQWLKQEPSPNTVKILSNARCLSEGVDVPALDAVLFLSPRNSQVDVVQSVGRVMRKSEGKDYGYVIIPVAVASFEDPVAALNDNKRFKMVWQVLQALRSHDERFSAMVNQISLEKKAPNNVGMFGVGGNGESYENETDSDSKGEIKSDAIAIPFSLIENEVWRDSVLSKLVDKVGQRIYWEKWAKDVADIVGNYKLRIQALLNNEDEKIVKAFEKFLKGLRKTLNPNITADDAIEMLAQHLVTEPIFDSLFQGYEFSYLNPVSIQMNGMIKVLQKNDLHSERESLESFYSDVNSRIEGITTSAGKQALIKELYDKFFQGAFKVTADKLGIVYTPIEVVDYMISAVENTLKNSFSSSLGSPGVHILDPFTGTGTFITRIMQSGLIPTAELEHKYRYDLHANEIVLLAYYVAAVNIEETFHGKFGGEYQPFPGLVMTDTFQMTEGQMSQRFEGEGLSPVNSERAIAQNSQEIQVIISNPPYSVGQLREGDGDGNERYEDLDKRIDDTYRKLSGAKLTKSLNDSYVRAFRWASDRIGDQGVVCFVSGGGWLIGNAMDGMRRCLVDEFAEIYVLDLRGNARTQGEKRQAEGGGIFGVGSQTAITVTLLVKKKAHTGPGTIHYHDIGDYLSREEKLAKLVGFAEHGPEWTTIVPNEFADWINQRRSDYGQLTPLGDENAKGKESEAIFTTFSRGVSTSRDTWTYSFSPLTLEESMTKLISTYEAVRKAVRSGDDPSTVPQTAADIKWDGALQAHLAKNRQAQAFDLTFVERSVYRPFTKQFLYFDRMLNNSVYRMPKFYRKGSPSPRAIVVSGVGSSSGFSALIVDQVPNLHTLDSDQVFPEFWFDDVEVSGGLFENSSNEPQRREGISKWALDQFTTAVGRAVDREAIFFYVYGILHGEQFREAYEDNLVKERPRIPLPKDAAQFEAFSDAGRKLSDLHLNYETVEPYPLDESCTRPELDPHTLYRVEKMRFSKGQGVKDRPGSILYNDYITLSGIPDETWDYMLSGKAALYWIIDRYKISRDADSGIINDPNDYSEDPRYILDLLKRIVTVSVKTLEIIRELPAITFD